MGLTRLLLHVLERFKAVLIPKTGAGQLASRVAQLTRGKKPNKIELNSAWRKGPDFLKLPESEWPINRVCTLQELPQEPKVIMIPNTKPTDSLAVMIDISRYLGYTGLVGLTARVLAMFRTEMRPESLSQRKQPKRSDFGCCKPKNL